LKKPKEEKRREDDFGSVDHVAAANAAASPTLKNKHSSHFHHPQTGKCMYLNHLRIRRQSLTYRGAMLNINRYRLRASSCPDIYRNSMTTIAIEEETEAGLKRFSLADGGGIRTGDSNFSRRNCGSRCTFWY
jgi:hypothetical protein